MRLIEIVSLGGCLALTAAWSCGGSSSGGPASSDAGDDASNEANDGFAGGQSDAGPAPSSDAGDAGASADSGPDAGIDSGAPEAGEQDVGVGDSMGTSDSSSHVALGPALLDGGAEYPQVVIDGTSSKLLVAATSLGSGKPVLYRCDIAGAGCTIADISAGQTVHADVKVALIDSTSSKLLVAAVDNPLTPALYRCNLDGTSCVHAGLSTHQVLFGMSAVLDAANGKLLVASGDDTGSLVAFFRCGVDGTGCVFSNLTASGLPAASFADPAMLLDSASNKLLVAAIDQTSSGASPGLFRCAADGTSCTYADLTAGHLYTTNNTLLPPAPSAVLDTAGSKLLVVGCYASMPGLVRCATDGTGCTFVDISQGRAAQSVQALIDTARAKLVVVALDSSYEPSVRECNLDGSGCVYTSLAYTGPSAPEFYTPSAALDLASQRVVAVSSNVATSQLYDFASGL